MLSKEVTTDSHPHGVPDSQDLPFRTKPTQALRLPLTRSQWSRTGTAAPWCPQPVPASTDLHQTTRPAAVTARPATLRRSRELPRRGWVLSTPDRWSTPPLPDSLNAAPADSPCVPVPFRSAHPDQVMPREGCPHHVLCGEIIVKRERIDYPWMRGSDEA